MKKKSNLPEYQSLGNSGNVVCPTIPTACCLLKQQSIIYLYVYCFIFLKFSLFEP